MSFAKKGLLGSKIFFHSALVLFGLSSAAGPLMINNAGVINTVLGIQTSFGSHSDGSYYDTKYENIAELDEASLEAVDKVVSEGTVLLKNKNNVLPLESGSSISCFGIGSHYTVLTGQGSSGAYSTSGNVNVYNGLKNAGFQMNAELDAFYNGKLGTAVSGTSGFIGGHNQNSEFLVNDIAWDNITSPKNKKVDTAVMVISRSSGEAKDLFFDITLDGGDASHVTGGSTGDALELSNNEKDVLANLKALKQAGTIKNIVVLLNEASPFQCEFIDKAEYDIDAALWIGTPGLNGCNAIGKIFSGEVNPSGRASDTFFANSKYNPVYFNFGNQQYGNSGILKAYKDSNNKYYTVYQEGIYNGYKYTETRYEDYVLGQGNAGDFDYDKVVSYPFGYGLSYSDFSYTLTGKKKNADNTYTLTVAVKNNSSVDGKEVVQVYVQKPYTAQDKTNGIEKPSVELVGFNKVLVKAGKTVETSITVEEKYFAAYDANVAKTYVIGGSEDYLITVAKDSHDAVNNILKYKNANTTKMVSKPGRGAGDASLVYNVHIDYSATKYSTNDFIKSENDNFTPHYEGEKANFGVNKITNQFDDADFKKAGIFSASEVNDQTYLSRKDWIGTYGQRITLTATDALVSAQAAPAVQKDSIEYPKFGEATFFTDDAGTFDEMKLIYLRAKNFNDPAWEDLLDKITFDELCKFLQIGYRVTQQIDSIGCPSTSQQNGAVSPVHERSYGELTVQSGFQGFVDIKDPDNRGKTPVLFPCNGLVASTYNTDLIEDVGEITGEIGIWHGYNGIYGLGVNIHRGAYCGRSFEYYSEDGFLTGVAAGYEAVGMHKYGVFVLAKHALLNDQESHRAGINAWANEQSIREIYGRALEVAIAIDRKYTATPMLGVMTGMNRVGAKWTGSQGFCNTLLKAEYGMRGYVVSDYNSTRYYMDPIQGVLNGNDLPDGNPAGGNSGKDYDGNITSFSNYKEGYGELVWAMRKSAKYILYTVVNSNAMNGIDGNSKFIEVVPVWQKAVPAVVRTSKVLFIWSAVIFGGFMIFDVSMKVVKGLKKQEEK